MIIQDHTVALQSYLKEEYEEKIELILAQATQKATEIRAQATTKNSQEIQKKIQALRTEAERKNFEQLAAKKYAAQQEVELTKSKLLQELIEQVKKEFTQLADKEKKQLIKTMYKELVQKIEEEGYDKDAFTYKVWKGVSIPGTKATLTELAVVAEGKKVHFEDSITTRLEEEKNYIKQKALEVLEG